MLREASGSGGLELAVTSDALAVRATTGEVRESGNLAGTTAEVTRLRLGLEGTWRGIVDGWTFVPGFEIGIRHDGGDAETGFGSDIGLGFIWTDPSRGIRADLRARGLLSHEDGEFRERGVAGTLSWDPASDRGWSFGLTQPCEHRRWGDERAAEYGHDAAGRN